MKRFDHLLSRDNSRKQLLLGKGEEEGEEGGQEVTVSCATANKISMYPAVAMCLAELDSISALKSSETFSQWMSFLFYFRPTVHSKPSSLHLRIVDRLAQTGNQQELLVTGSLMSKQFIIS